MPTASSVVSMRSISRLTSASYTACHPGHTSRTTAEVSQKLSPPSWGLLRPAARSASSTFYIASLDSPAQSSPVTSSRRCCSRVSGGSVAKP